MNRLSHYLSVTVKGICMGAADVIPGVSGGTIAFLTGIYSELVESIKSVDLTAVRLLFTGKIGQFWNRINGTFLISLLTGILISVFSLARVMKYLLVNHPIQLWAFFFGLILISAVYIFKNTGSVKFIHILCAAAGAGAGAFICLVTPGETPDDLWFIFICGTIGICAMILPGISGSFILLLMGKYEYIVADAVGTFNIPILTVFACGAVIGIIAFSHFLSWLLRHYYQGTLMFLAGLMIGSLIKIWPWKSPSGPGTDHPVWPGQYMGDPHTGSALLFFIIGTALFLCIELTAKRIKK